MEEWALLEVSVAAWFTTVVYMRTTVCEALHFLREQPLSVIIVLRAKVGGGVMGASYTCKNTTWSSSCRNLSAYPVREK